MDTFERLRIDGRPVSGHAFLVQRARGPQWYVKFRLPDGRQVQRRLGPAWTGRGRPAAGYLTRRWAQAVLDELLAQARAGTLPGMIRTGATFAQASREWLHWQEFDRQRKRSTLDDYRSAVRAHLDPEFGTLALEEVTSRRIEDWRRSLVEQQRLSNRSINKLLILLHGIFERSRRVWGMRENPVRDVDRQPTVRRSHIDVYSLEEILALVRAADPRQDGAIFLTAALTGLRMGELLALLWRDVDFALPVIRVRASYSHRQLTTPKSGKGRAVPMIDQVARALAQLGQRDELAGPDDLVFAGPLGGYLDDSALRRRYKTARAQAGLRPLRFHDLRHTFGTHAIRTADPRELQEWMGHADFSTTEIYLSYKPRAEAARRLADAFSPTRGATADAYPAVGG
jgi:integrase